jgi:hypothetical protein
MEIRSGWLERSLERAHTNIQQRPERLKPARYRASRSEGKSSAPKTQSKISAD